MINEIFTSKRKSCVCRIHLAKNNAEYHTVNGKKLEIFFSDIPFYVRKIYLVTSLFKLEQDFKFNCNVKGGGKCAQADAIRYAIAKFLKKYFMSLYKQDIDKFNEVNSTLRKAKLLTVDTRKPEPKHYGRLKSRCKRQRSKR